MKRINNILLSLPLFMLLLLFAGCIKEDGECPSNGETPVRILTSISFGMDTPSARSTRGVTDTNYEEGKDDGTEAERAVKALRVMAFNVSDGSVQHNQLYNEGEFKTKTENGKLLYYVDMQILSGYYRFVMVANENAAWNLNGVSNYSGLANTATSFANNLLTVADVTANGIPMIGEQFLSIPGNPASTATNPQEIHPVVELKRTVAKTEITLTNQTTPGTVNLYAKNYQIKAIYVEKLNTPYNVFEHATAPITETYIAYTAGATPATTYRAITHTAGTPYAGTFIYYMAERKNVANDANATAIVIVASKTGAADDTTFRIPLYQTTNHALGGTKDYGIFRNTFYKLNCVLNGTELAFIEVFYSVSDWDLVTSSTLMGYGYNVEITGNKITVSNTVAACAPHEVKLEPLGGATINGATTAVTFNQLGATDSQTYTLENLPTAPGTEYLKVYYNDYTLVKTYTINY